MQDLRVSIIQTDLYWEDKAKNLAKMDNWFKDLPKKTDLVVLPEMFTTGFSMNPTNLAEKMDGETVQWMRQKAQNHQCTLVGSLIIEENGKYYNRLVWMNPTGKFNLYDKRHLFTFANEHIQYTAGNKQIDVSLKSWKIRPLICYDLRFPVWSRNNSDYDMLVYIGNWPTKRIAHWKYLLIARAIENQCFVIGVNRVGIDGNGITHNGNSMIISPKGEILTEVTDVETLESLTLPLPKLLEYRQKFPALQDQDHFLIN